jgi:hypothetical protein
MKHFIVCEFCDEENESDEDWKVRSICGVCKKEFEVKRAYSVYTLKICFASGKWVKFDDVTDHVYNRSLNMLGVSRMKKYGEQTAYTFNWAHVESISKFGLDEDDPAYFK